MVASSLDVYLLQEVDEQQIRDDMFGDRALSQLLKQEYDCIHYTHPTRQAKDGVAFLLRKSRFQVERSEIVPYEAKLKEDAGKKYMCAAVAYAKDKATGLRLLFGSVHFYNKKSLHPEETFLNYVNDKKDECDAIVWGGDCNRSYTSANPPGKYGEFTWVEGGETTNTT
jgi:exonuclease III